MRRFREECRVRPPCYQTWINIRRWCGYIGSGTPYQRKIYDGIGICEEWLSFQTFQEWCLSNGWKPGMCLVRKDKGKDFSPENCIIVTKQIANGLRTVVRRLPDGRSARDIIGTGSFGRDRIYHNRVANRLFNEKMTVEEAVFKGRYK